MISENRTGNGMPAPRADFPALSTRVHDRPLVYLDNAATTQMPTCVIHAVAASAREGRANVRRGLHALGERATNAYERARSSAQRFLHARESREIVFVRGATEAVNLVAHSFGTIRVGAGDEILVTHLEHHSNIVPWQMLCERVGARLAVVPVTDEGEVRLSDVEAMVGPRTRLVAAAHVSNAIGTINPVRAIADIAHARGAVLLVDGAQAAPHVDIDVVALDCDFYTFSGHKCYGPTGIGVLYGRAELLDRMPPFLGGGDMVRSVTFERTVYDAAPHRFEAGTPNVEGAIGLAAALAYLGQFEVGAVAAHEAALLAHATERLRGVPGVRLVGEAREKAAIVSFVVDGVHAHDVGTILDRQGVAVRAGHHCAQPLLARFGLPATVRASFGLYNTVEDVEALVAGLAKVEEIFG
jgi:cysteine desulfurase / selenocysteine lyase